MRRQVEPVEGPVLSHGNVIGLGGRLGPVSADRVDVDGIGSRTARREGPGRLGGGGSGGVDRGVPAARRPVVVAHPHVVEARGAGVGARHLDVHLDGIAHVQRLARGRHADGVDLPLLDNLEGDALREHSGSRSTFQVYVELVGTRDAGREIPLGFLGGLVARVDGGVSVALRPVVVAYPDVVEAGILDTRRGGGDRHRVADVDRRGVGQLGIG